MAQYSTYVQGTTYAGTAHEDSFIEITGTAAVSFLLKRVRVSCNTANSDACITVRVARMAGAGSTGTSFTPVKKRVLTAASTSTCSVKNGASAFTPGTTTVTYHQDNVNGRAIWEWIPRGNEEIIDSGASGIIAVIISASVASLVVNCVAEFEE